MKIIIYGLGSGRERVEKYLKKEHEVIGYSDSFYKGNLFNNIKFYRPEELSRIEYDYIVIAIGNKDIYEKVQLDLINYGVTNIVNFYEIYNSSSNKRKKYVDKILYNTKRMEGIVLGISNAYLGINTKCFQKSFYNLAISSQDLFYNFKQLEHLVKNYKDKIMDLEYVIIDMYDYTYFNYDVSLSKGAIDFYMWSGFGDEESHNYKDNRNFNNSIEEEIQMRDKEDENITRIKKIYEELFCIRDIETDMIESSKCYLEDYPEETLVSNSITNNDIDEYKSQYKLNGLQRKLHVNTEKENIQIFKQILDTLFNINSNMKIYLILIPKYIEVEKRLKVVENYWKIRFYNILDKFREEYNFQILDFKDTDEIRTKKEYYLDLKHLNYKGAEAFTRMLDSYIY